MPSLSRAPNKKELEKLISIYLKAETAIINEIGRLRSQGLVDYHAVAALEQCGVPREGLIQEKAELYDRLAELNRQIRAERRKLALCRKTQNSLPRMEQEIDKAEARESEVRTNEHRRR